jgi:pimeloyl-ACP methyl ester carboxylesterase
MMCAMPDPTPQQKVTRPFPWARVLLALVSVVLLLVLCAVLAVWRAPLWVSDLAATLRFHHAGLHSRTISIGGRTVHYFEGGAGEPVVLIHGLGSWASQDWSELAPALIHAGGFHVYALDLLGYGESDKPADRAYSIPEQARLVVAFLDAHKLDRVVLGGESMGGWIAATVAINEPERVSRLMLFDSAGMNFKLSFDPAVFTPQTPEQVDQLMHLVMPDPPKIPRFVKQAIVRKNQRDGWVVQRALASMEAGHDFLEPKFASITAPVLIVWGAVDALTPLSSGEEMHRLAPQSVLEVYAGCGHIAVETCSARVAPRVIAFLNDNGPAPGARVDVP